MTFWQWKAWVTPEKVKAHWAWYERGKQGEGRLVVEDRDLRGMARIRQLDGARFVRCDLSYTQLSQCSLEELELIECTVDDAAFSLTTLERGRFERSTFRRTNFVLADLSGTAIERGSFAQANARSSTWLSVRARGTDFRAACFSMARLDASVFEGCDFRDAQFVRDEPEGGGGTARSALFVDCDFGGADVTGWELDHTRFERCRLAGSRGKPNLAGPVALRDNDLTEAQLLARWR